MHRSTPVYRMTARNGMNRQHKNEGDQDQQNSGNAYNSTPQAGETSLRLRTDITVRIPTRPQAAETKNTARGLP